MDRIGGKEDGGAADIDLDFSAANTADLKGLDSGSEDEVDDSDVPEGDDDSEEEPELEGEDDGSDSVEFDDIGDLGSDDEEDEFGEEQFALSDDDDQPDEQPLPGPGPSKRKRKGDLFAGSKKKRKNSPGGDLQSLLASAEEFSDLMDQNDGGREFEGSSEAVSTVKDKAGKKQLKWEREKAERKKWNKGNAFQGGKKGGRARFKKR